MVFFLQWAKICDRFKSAAHAMESYWSSAHLENNQSQFVHLMPATLATQHTNDNTELSLSLYLQFFNIWNPENETKNQKKFFIVRSIWYDFSACKQKILWFSSKQLNCIQVVRFQWWHKAIAYSRNEFAEYIYVFVVTMQMTCVRCDFSTVFVCAR